MLFSDVIVPGGLNGDLLARELRETRPGLRIPLTTGDAGDAKTLTTDGSTFEVLGQPYRFDELARGVRRALDTP